VTECRNRAFGEIGTSRLIGDIGLDEHRFAPVRVNRGKGLRGICFTDVSNDDAGSVGSELDRRGPANAAGSTGDDGHLA
jgi:hypothetical protein